MKLDKRILPGRKPLTCFDVEEARNFIDKIGYFSSVLSQYRDLEQCSYGYLRVVNDNRTPFVISNSNNRYEFFLPIDWVKEPEPKFIPYTLDTWEQDFKPGDVVTFRGKKNTDRAGSYYKCVYSGYRFIAEKGSTNTIAILGLWAFSFSELFDLYEIYRNGTWEPFGRKTNEG